MEFKKFLRLLWRRKFLLIVVPILAAILTFVLTNHLPQSYQSRARISTGLVSTSSQKIIEGQLFFQESEINLKFDNLIQTIQLKVVLDKVTYRLLLNALENGSFKKPSKILTTIIEDSSFKRRAIEVVTNVYNSKAKPDYADSTYRRLHEVSLSMGYDDESLRKSLFITRVNSSDYIDLYCTSENPQYSAFILSTLFEEFIKYYNSTTNDDIRTTISFLDSLKTVKKIELDSLINDLRIYKTEHNVLNLLEQEKIIFNQLADFESKKEILEKEIEGYTGAIKSIDAKFKPEDRKYLEASISKLNQEIINNKDLLQQTNEQYIKSNYNEALAKKVDSLSKVLQKQIADVSDKYINNPLAAKELLVQQKIQLEVNLAIAKNSIASVSTQLEVLKKRAQSLVPHSAEIAKRENPIDVATKEYENALSKYNQASLENSLTSSINLVQPPIIPTEPMPSKRLLIIAVSFIASLILCMVILFALFLLDNRIETAEELAQITDLPVIASLSLLTNNKNICYKDLWQSEMKKEDYLFLPLLRNLRFEIFRELETTKILMLTSLRPGVGKTFVALNLAEAFKQINKRVLILDGNFANNEITRICNPTRFLEDYYHHDRGADENKITDLITVIGNRGSNKTIFEIVSPEKIAELTQLIKSMFDFIIIEIPALDSLNKAKEWMTLADKTIAVFEINDEIPPDMRKRIDYIKHNFSLTGWVFNKVKTHKFVRAKD